MFVLQRLLLECCYQAGSEIFEDNAADILTTTDWSTDYEIVASPNLVQEIYDHEAIEIVARKLKKHPFQKIRTQYKPEQLATANGLMKTFFNKSIIQSRYLQVKLLLVHTGIWRYVPDQMNLLVQQRVKTMYGLMHCALGIGPYLIDWNSASLITPRSLKSTSPLLFADLQGGRLDLKMNPTAIPRICQVIALWNASHVYSRIGCNCQEFVLDMLRALELPLELPPTSPLGMLVRDLRIYGEGNMVFTDTIWKRKKITFKKHAALDKYVTKLMKHLHKHNKDLKRDYQEHYVILKAFDRAFWLMVDNGNVDQKLCKPYRCPFGDARNEE